MTNANQVFVEKEKLSLSVIKQYRVVCPTTEAKSQVLSKTIFPLCDKLGQTIIFVRTRDEARKLCSETPRPAHPSPEPRVGPSATSARAHESYSTRPCNVRRDPANP